ncbi:hypothetical protein ACLB2K_059345 [Fragaria x ananassa]
MLKNVVVEGGTSQITPTTIRWSPPHSNHIKINFDGSVQGRAVAGGFVFRDNEGMVLLAAANSFGNATIPTAEATALRDSRVEAKDQGFSNIQVESDSKLVIDAINGRISTPWRLLKIIQDIRMIAMSFTSISFKYIFREANFVADANIAHEGHLLPNGCTWMGAHWLLLELFYLMM